MQNLDDLKMTPLLVPGHRDIVENYIANKVTGIETLMTGHRNSDYINQTEQCPFLLNSNIILVAEKQGLNVLS